MSTDTSSSSSSTYQYLNQSSDDTTNGDCSSTTWVSILKVVVAVIVLIIIILLIMMIVRAISRPRRFLRDQQYDYTAGQPSITIDTRQPQFFQQNPGFPPQNPDYNPPPPPTVNVSTVQAAISPPTMTGPSIYPLVYSRGY
jgi:hypothetical protein